MVGPPKEAGMQWLTMCSRNEVKVNQKIVWKKHHYANLFELTTYLLQDYVIYIYGLWIKNSILHLFDQIALPCMY